MMELIRCLVEFGKNQDSKFVASIHPRSIVKAEPFGKRAFPGKKRPCLAAEASRMLLGKLPTILRRRGGGISVNLGERCLRSDL